MITDEDRQPAGVPAQLRQLGQWMRELKQIAEQQAIERAREMERIRGIKDMTYRVPPFTAAATLTIAEIPVNQGYSWNLKMITAKVSAADTVVAYLGESANGAIIGAAVAVGSGTQIIAQVTWTSSQKVLHAGESIFLQTSGGATLSNVTVFGVQVPAEQIGKIVS